MTSRSSLRFRLADDLRERIASGEVAPGERLPSEPSLARSLGVSRASVRAAITMLEEDGLVRRRQGSGTYVSRRSVLRNDLGRNFGVGALIVSTGLEPGTEDELVSSEPAPDDVAASFGVETGTLLNVLRRVRTANGRRVVDSVEWCRPEDLDLEALASAARRSLYAALAERGLAVDHGVARLTPDIADGEVAQRLDVPRGALLLTLFQVDEAEDGRPVLVSEERYLADAFEVSVLRRGPGARGEA